MAKNADVLVENRDECVYYGNYRIQNPDGKVEIKRHVFEPSSQGGMTRVPRKVWEALLQTGGGNNRIASMVEQGRLVANGYTKQSDEVKHQIDMREANYARFVGVYKEVAKMDGQANSMLASFVDESGIPNLALTRENVGRHVSGEEHKAFVTRLKGEIRDNLHQKSLLIPGFVRTKDVDTSKVIDTGDSETDPDADTRFEKLLQEVKDALPEMKEDDFDKAGQPMTAALKKFGINVSKDDRDYIWKLHLETQTDENK